jgi:hypothetical protein
VSSEEVTLSHKRENSFGVVAFYNFDGFPFVVPVFIPSGVSVKQT